MEKLNKLEWEEAYSVGVALIDEQHKMLIATINELLDVIDTKPTKEKTDSVINKLIQYKQFHFATEEKYFKEFNYKKTDEHIAKHRLFTKKITEIQNRSTDNYVALVYELIDFLENWFVDHLLHVDHEYIECFHQHGLR